MEYLNLTNGVNFHGFQWGSMKSAFFITMIPATHQPIMVVTVTASLVMGVQLCIGKTSNKLHTLNSREMLLLMN